MDELMRRLLDARSSMEAKIHDLKEEREQLLLRYEAMRNVLQELRKMYILNAWMRPDINEKLIASIREVLFEDQESEKRERPS